MPDLNSRHCKLVSASVIWVSHTGLIEGDDPKEALKGFQEVVSMEAEKGEWWALDIPQMRVQHYHLLHLHLKSTSCTNLFLCTVYTPVTKSDQPSKRLLP